MVRIPQEIQTWFAGKGWRIRPHQRAMVQAFAAGQSTLLIAPTGTGKTIAGFLASLMDIHKHNGDFLHTLYISPLKALTNDIQRNLLVPIEEMKLDVRVDSRTSDTSSHRRARQRRKPPQILLTTPESLMLMLSYPEAVEMFSQLKLVVIDEVHSIAPSKRGDFLALALARLKSVAPGHIRFGLSATVADPQGLAAWLGLAGQPAQVVDAGVGLRPKIGLLKAKARLPYGGFSVRYALPEIYQAIQGARTSIVFVNTRAQCERLFQLLWEANTEDLPIAIYHGSLTKEQRQKTEARMAAGGLRAVVATSALELGVDWGDVDLVINVGAPKGVSRLLQRVGRSNHRMDQPSRALLVPANHFEVLECVSALEAIKHGEMDGAPLLPGSLDVVVQYIINCACSGPVRPEILYQEMLQALPYSAVPEDIFTRLFNFAVDGGYVLKHYDRYARLVDDGTGNYNLASRSVAMRHRLNIGVISDGARLQVLRQTPKKRGRVVGEIDEVFAQNLAPGDTFLFGGEVLEFLQVRDLFLEAQRSKAKQPKIPAYSGSAMPLSTFLGDGVRVLLGQPKAWHRLPAVAQTWLGLQQKFSRVPGANGLLVEHFPFKKRWLTVLYTFEGRKANQTLGMLLTRRMERAGLQPLSFTISDYALCLNALKPLTEVQCSALLNPEMIIEDLEAWLLESPMLKRAFRQVATISGISEKRMGGARKSMKQMTFSTDLVWDVLRRHEPDHILLHVARSDAERELLDVARLADLLIQAQQQIDFITLSRPSPMSIPILLESPRDFIDGEGLETLLFQKELQQAGDLLMNEVRDAVAE